VAKVSGPRESGLPFGVNRSKALIIVASAQSRKNIELENCKNLYVIIKILACTKALTNQSHCIARMEITSICGLLILGWGSKGKG
jgi:hypothetical protein